MISARHSKLKNQLQTVFDKERTSIEEASKDAREQIKVINETLKFPWPENSDVFLQLSNQRRTLLSQCLQEQEFKNCINTSDLSSKFDNEETELVAVCSYLKSKFSRRTTLGRNFHDSSQDNSLSRRTPSKAFSFICVPTAYGKRAGSPLKSKESPRAAQPS